MSAKAAPPDSPWGHMADILKYWAEIDEILALFKAAGRLAVGQAEPVPAIIIDNAGKRYRWEHDQIFRER